MNDRGYGNAFEWYDAIIKLGNFEVEHGRARFYSTAKLHLAILGGVITLVVYASATERAMPLGLGLLGAAFGLLSARSWLRQLEAASTWEARWRVTASAIEDTDEFRSVVGMHGVRAWSHEEVRRRLNPVQKKSGASSAFYWDFAWNLSLLYWALTAGSMVGFLWLVTHSA